MYFPREVSTLHPGLQAENPPINMISEAWTQMTSTEVVITPVKYF